MECICLHEIMVSLFFYSKTLLNLPSHIEPTDRAEYPMAVQVVRLPSRHLSHKVFVLRFRSFEIIPQLFHVESKV
jgi:hypothetical protein